MPEEKKNQGKNKNDPKEQRRPRGRQKAGAGEKKNHAESNFPSEKTKVSEPQKPVYEDPGPEFYKNLKRETDDILKITEEANSKYKKKEIQSNWAKYEMPVESYDDIEEQENMGADYEKLAEMPLSIGGHFQFKHEKSWDVNTGPSLYDKYFDINMNDLALAISTLPFYERNNIDKDIFTSTDLLTMDNRATKYSRKYYNDKSYTTSELEAIDKTISNLKVNVDPSEETRNKTKDIDIDKNKDEIHSLPQLVEVKPVNKDLETESHNDVSPENTSPNKIIENKDITVGKTELKTTEVNKSEILDDIDDLILDSTEDVLPNKETERENIEKPIEIVSEPKVLKAADNHTTTLKPPKNPVIESPEDLEKWLDDFLDD